MSDLTIVTGASDNHFKCLRNLLYSLSLFEPHTRTLIYDLGLETSRRRLLLDEGREVRSFRFEDYPDYFDIRVQRGHYAWKPVIVADTMAETRGPVLWLDAGNLVHARLERLRATLRENGLYSPTSSGTIARWTHPGTLDYLDASPALLPQRNRNGAIVGFAPDFPGVNDLVREWKRCALERDCIAPEGSGRANHRQDQAVLSVLLYQYQEKYGYRLTDKKLDISTHNDRLSRSRAIDKLKTRPCSGT